MKNHSSLPVNAVTEMGKIEASPLVKLGLWGIKKTPTSAGIAAATAGAAAGTVPPPSWTEQLRKRFDSMKPHEQAALIGGLTAAGIGGVGGALLSKERKRQSALAGILGGGVLGAGLGTLAAGGFSKPKEKPPGKKFTPNPTGIVEWAGSGDYQRAVRMNNNYTPAAIGTAIGATTGAGTGMGINRYYKKPINSPLGVRGRLASTAAGILSAGTGYALADNAMDGL